MLVQYANFVKKKKKDPETREHFLTCCKILQNIRSVYLSKIRSLFEPSSDRINSLLDNPARCIQLLLDSSHLDIKTILQPNSTQISELELYSRLDIIL